MKMTMDITIQAPVSEVFEVFSDIKNAENHIEGIDAIEVVQSNDNFVGTRWRETRTEFGRTETVEMWVTQAQENRFYEVESEAHGTHYLSRYDFETIDAGSTKVTLTFEGKPKTVSAKLMSVMMIFFAGATKKLFMKDMQDLKKLLEKS